MWAAAGFSHDSLMRMSRELIQIQHICCDEGKGGKGFLILILIVEKCQFL